jgi:hypothetical protein
MNKCDNCGKEALIDYCNEHINSDFTCYELTCMACSWHIKECDTTKHCEVAV